MSKGLKGFLVGMFVVIVGFVLTVLIMASVNGRTFTDEIKSWGGTEESTEVPDDVIDDNVNEEDNGDETTGDETNTDEGVETEPTAVISIFNGNFNLKVA